MEPREIRAARMIEGDDPQILRGEAHSKRRLSVYISNEGGVMSKLASEYRDRANDALALSKTAHSHEEGRLHLKRQRALNTLADSQDWLATDFNDRLPHQGHVTPESTIGAIQRWKNEAELANNRGLRRCRRVIVGARRLGGVFELL